MAEEAAVENLAISRFFCHKCNREINHVQSDYLCPNCQCGFIEKLEVAPEPNEDNDSDMEVVQPFELINDMLMGLTGGMLEERRGSGRGRRRGGRARHQNLLQDFIVNLTEVGLGGLGVTPRTGGPVLFLGNPGDYAWGREGLDAIVTQLLNQMDGTGPPPLTKDKIQEIPIVIITQDQVDSSLQCSVCWEDFKISEPVRKLSCEHVYHEPCIIPWLELHGTCPICRKALSEESGREDNNQVPLFGTGNGGGGVGRNLAALFRAANDSASSRASSTSSSDSGSTSSSNTSRSDYNMDLEFD